MNKVISLDFQEFSFLNTETDELVQCKALDSNLCSEKLSGTIYSSIPSSLSENNKNKFNQSLDAIINDLSWVLSLDYAKFWCQVINDELVHHSINSYLRLAPRYRQELWPLDFVQKHNLLHRLVFMVCLRMSTPKESPENFMTPSYFADLLYENFLFDIPSLMDICSLYAVPENVELLTKMISSVFKHQPSYFDDLENSSHTVLQVFTELEKKCGFSFEETEKERPTELNTGLPSLELLKLNGNELSDIVLYLSDVLHTLKAFSVVVFEPSCEYFYKAGILDKFANCYSNIVPKLQTVITERSDLWEKTQFLKLRTHLRQSREHIKEISHHYIKVIFCTEIANAVDKGKRDEATVIVESYLKFLSGILSHQKFVADLNKKSRLTNDLTTTMEEFSDICEEQYAYILQSLNQTKQKPPSKNNHITNQSTSKIETILEPTPQCSNSQPVSNSKSTESLFLIQSVRDVLPHLDSDFIDKCLKRCDMSPEKVIQLYLENNLPPDIVENEVFANSSPQKSRSLTPEKQITEQDFISDRKNIFDHDQFDVFHHDTVDRTQIHRGKVEKPDAGHWKMENEVEHLRDLYSKYGIVEDEGSDVEFNVNVDNPSLYDDEYDDTYDDVAVVNEGDSLSDDELISRRPFQTPRVLDQGKNKQVREKNQEEDVDDETPKPKRDEFIQNPEIVRANREARWRQKQSERKGKPRSENSGGNTEKERKKKEAQKSSRANHNRKNLATKKFSKGMA